MEITEGYWYVRYTPMPYTVQDKPEPLPPEIVEVFGNSVLHCGSEERGRIGVDTYEFICKITSVGKLTANRES